MWQRGYAEDTLCSPSAEDAHGSHGARGSEANILQGAQEPSGCETACLADSRCLLLLLVFASIRYDL